MAGRAIGRTLEMGVAETAIAALGKQGARAGPIEIGDQRCVVFFIDFGSHGHTKDGVRTIRPCHLLAHAMTAAFRGKVLLVAVVYEGIEVLDGFGPDIAATAAVAAIGSAELNELLAT